MSNKVDEKDLLELRKLNQSFNECRFKISDIEFSIKDLTNQKNDVFSEMNNLSSMFRELEKTLLDKYGKVSINVDTGEIKEIEQKENNG